MYKTTTAGWPVLFRDVKKLMLAPKSWTVHVGGPETIHVCRINAPSRRSGTSAACQAVGAV